MRTMQRHPAQVRSDCLLVSGDCLPPLPASTARLELHQRQHHSFTLQRCMPRLCPLLTAANSAPAAAGYQLVSVTTPSTLPTATCALDAGLSYGNPALFGQCTLTAGSTYLSLYVDQYCGGERASAAVSGMEAGGLGRQSVALAAQAINPSPLPACACAVQISPVKDAACSEPAAGYWSSMKIRAHYVTPALIASSLNTAATNLTRCVRCKCLAQQALPSPFSPFTHAASSHLPAPLLFPPAART